MGFEEIVKSLSQEQQDVITAEVEKAKQGAVSAFNEKIKDAIKNPVEKAEDEDEMVSCVAKAIVEATKTVEVVKAADSDEDIIKAMPESIQKAYRDMQKKAATAENVAKALADEKVTKEYVEKAAIFKSIPTTKEELGSILKSVGSADADVCKKLEAILTAADKLIEDGGIFKEHGKATSSNTEQSAMTQLDAKAAEVKKANPSLTKEAAFAKAMQENPDLYTSYMKELEEEE